MADAVVLDHFIGGDGSPTGTRTAQDAVPGAMAAIDPESVTLAYRDRMAEIAQRHLPGRVGLPRRLRRPLAPEASAFDSSSALKIQENL